MTFGIDHVGHAFAALAGAAHLHNRVRTAAPVLLTILGFTPVQVEMLIGGFAIGLLQIKSRLPNQVHVHH